MNSMREEPREEGLATPTAIVLVVDDEKRSLERLRVAAEKSALRAGRRRRFRHLGRHSGHSRALVAARHRSRGQALLSGLTRGPSSVRFGEENMGITQTRIARIVVGGVVQGVGYRVFVAREAGRLHLDGWVRNRRDGTVEMLVAGPNGAVDEFLIAALRGPKTAVVASHRIEAADEAALREGGGGHGFVVAGEA